MGNRWRDRCVPLTDAGLLDVLTRARARDREDHLLATGKPYDPLKARALIGTPRWAVLIQDATGQPQAAVYAVPAAEPGDWLACISATDGWRDVWRTATRYIAEVMIPSMLVSPDVRRGLVVVAGAEERAVRFAQLFGLRPSAVQVPGAVILERWA